ncbi:32258_t:CDS:2 [Gigaspora margarita]|uniref:32258_t:CDS:1 n=1 Tax=Gigaspora margarita TaxID=4874 RepID=A0ABN7ULZ3_GIGMA|nr:32258_t:CDS:2 [Gigaspora margarita]
MQFKLIAHAIKRYISDLTEGSNIEKALQNLSRTSIAYIEPNHNQANIEPDSESLK